MNTECTGCVNDILNQLGHIDCPDGCLHDVNNCNIMDIQKNNIH